MVQTTQYPKKATSTTVGTNEVETRDPDVTYIDPDFCELRSNESEIVRELRIMDEQLDELAIEMSILEERIDTICAGEVPLEPTPCDRRVVSSSLGEELRGQNEALEGQLIGVKALIARIRL